MMDFYRGWNDLVRDLLSYVPKGEINEWTLNSHRPLPRWIENECALIGDSCHPMLPYVAQGAAQAIEDTAVLTVSLSLADDVPTALGVYEAVRKSRGEAIQNSAATTRQALHLPDGPEQEKRDKAIAGTGPNPDLWADHDWQDFMWGVDVMKDRLEDGGGGVGCSGPGASFGEREGGRFLVCRERVEKFHCLSDFASISLKSPK